METQESKKNMNVMDSMKQSIVVPVVVIENAKDAVPTAKALLAGGINVMEITLRTAAALDSIRNVAKECPDMVVGVGTVLNVDQAKEAVEAGAKFIVSPGFDEETVKWCIENKINITPGCVTPTEIMAARKLGLRVLKFFPASVYGGLNAITNLAAPFIDIQFIPTGGVSTENIAEFVANPAIFAVVPGSTRTGGSITAFRIKKIIPFSGSGLAVVRCQRDFKYLGVYR